jgi:hypothetical protein
MSTDIEKPAAFDPNAAVEAIRNKIRSAILDVMHDDDPLRDSSQGRGTLSSRTHGVTMHVTPCYSDSCAPCLALRLKSKEQALQIAVAMRNEYARALEEIAEYERPGCDSFYLAQKALGRVE